jgi:tRNA synthetase class II core domain (G, H, P, S and T)
MSLTRLTPPRYRAACAGHGHKLSQVIDLKAARKDPDDFRAALARRGAAADFDKVEMYVCCLPEESKEFHERLLGYEEEIVQALGLPYRVQNISVGDLGAPAARKYDIEAWFPVQGRYREITSCSNTTDYQARRLLPEVLRPYCAPATLGG